MPSSSRRLIILALCLLVLAVLLVTIVLKPERKRHHRGLSARVEATVTTADLSLALSRQHDVSFTSAPSSAPTIYVDETKRYQVIKGVGAAMTDSSAWLLYTQLPASARNRVMTALFGRSGATLAFLRVPMGASDFTAKRTPYSYDDMPIGRGDPGLPHFSIAHDKAYVLPLLRQARELNPEMYVLASPWTPPGWMKANHRLDDLGHTGGVLSSALPDLARYFVKFITAYLSQGVHINAVTPQNEPGNPSVYPGAELSVAQEENFVRLHLAPALRRAGLKTDIYGYDLWDAREAIPYAAQLERGPAAKNLAGIATHCYFGPPTVMSYLHQLNRLMDQMVSECSPGLHVYSTSELEVSSIRNWASAVNLWNLALDPSGQPVQPPNSGCPSCTGVVTVNESTHTVAFTLDYYQLGQVSKFIRPGAVRIASNNFVTYRYTGPGQNIASPGLDDVAFRNPDGSKVLVVYNNSPVGLGFGVSSRGRYFSYLIAPWATDTFVWDRPSR
jgi:glucosylceramidase